MLACLLLGRDAAKRRIVLGKGGGKKAFRVNFPKKVGDFLNKRPLA
jgi:hypothetical protein